MYEALPYLGMHKDFAFLQNAVSINYVLSVSQQQKANNDNEENISFSRF